ncbi:hypothetical protein F2P79_015163 [Pimephales promelas]|nr:hypothetical protein F2P79_015163 [Pimephales promelas]
MELWEMVFTFPYFILPLNPEKQQLNLQLFLPCVILMMHGETTASSLMQIICPAHEDYNRTYWFALMQIFNFVLLQWVSFHFLLQIPK